MKSLLEIELKHILRAIRRWWWIPVLLTIVFGLLAYGLASMQEPAYTARTQLLVTPPTTNSALIVQESNQAETYRSLVESGPVLDRVIEDLGLDSNRLELAERINAVVLFNTQIIEITVTDTDSQRAADIANSVAQNFQAQVANLTTGQLEGSLEELQAEAERHRTRVLELDRQIQELDTAQNADDSEIQNQVSTLKAERLRASQTVADIEGSIRTVDAYLSTSTTPVAVADTALPPREPNSPAPLVITLLGAFLGGLIGVAAMIALELMNRTVRDEDDVERVLGPSYIQSVRTSDLTNEGAVVPGLRLLQPLVGRKGQSLAIVTPRDAQISGQLTNALVSRSATDAHHLVDGGALFADRPTDERRPGGVILALKEGKTTRDDFETAVELLAVEELPIVATVLVK